MNSAPSCSVIIATYNRDHLIGRAVRSVLAQTYDDFELIVVDDASVDDTEEVVASYCDDRIVYVRREENGGPSAAWNTGIRQARGKYVSFLDDDDEYHPEFLEETHRRFEAAPERVGFMGCGIRQIDTTRGNAVVTDKIPSMHRSSSPGEAYLCFLRAIPFGTGWGVTVRHACFSSVGLFDEELQAENDRDFLIRLAHDFDFEIIPIVLTRHYIHSGPKVTIYSSRTAQAYEHMLRKHVQTLRAHPSLWAGWHYKTGWLYYHSGNRIRGKQFLLRGLRPCPWHLRTWALLVIFEAFGSRGPRVHRFLSSLFSRFRVN